MDAAPQRFLPRNLKEPRRLDYRCFGRKFNWIFWGHAVIQICSSVTEFLSYNGGPKLCISFNHTLQKYPYQMLSQQTKNTEGRLKYAGRSSIKSNNSQKKGNFRMRDKTSKWKKWRTEREKKSEAGVQREIVQKKEVTYVPRFPFFTSFMSGDNFSFLLFLSRNWRKTRPLRHWTTLFFHVILQPSSFTKFFSKTSAFILKKKRSSVVRFSTLMAD